MVQMKETVVAEGWDNEWLKIINPMGRALSGDDPGYGNIDDDWDEDDPEALDFWKSDGWIGRSNEASGDDVLMRAQATENAANNTANREAPAPVITLPDEKDEGFRTADQTLARRGRQPDERGGSGKLFDVAKEFIGTPYVFGAAGPTAFDCSGFVTYLYSRVYGVALPHQALQQAQVTEKVSRQNIQPGDLIFYSYGRLGSQIDHVEIYMGGNKQIGTANPNEDLDIDDIDWANVTQIGRVNSPNIDGIAAGTAGGVPREVKDPALGKPKAKVVTKPVEQDAIMAPSYLSGEYGDAAFSTTLAEVLTGDEVSREVRYRTPAKLGGAVEQQLYRGFMDQGRADLARMVGTKDFQTWIQQESGWRVDATSPANNNGLANDGLFQIWRGHDYNSNGQVSRMSPYEQAGIVARYFGHLNPSDIRRYAASIRAGTYSGWG